MISLLVMFIVAGTLLKLSFWRFWQACLFGAACAAWVLWSCRWAVEQSKPALQAMLAGSMQDLSVLLTIETALFLSFALLDRRWLRYYPGLLVFPALFWLQTQLIFTLPGSSFSLISWGLACAVAVLVPLLSWGARRLYPVREQRLEALFFVSLLMCAVGLISTQTM